MTGTWNSYFDHVEDDDWHSVLQACEEGVLDLKSMITHKLAFDDLFTGLSIMKDKLEYRNKIMIVK